MTVLKPPTTQERYVGCLLGLAVGDSVGSANEFKTRAACDAAPVTGMAGGGPFRLKPGEWTDDTSMAVVAASHLATYGGVYAEATNWRPLMDRWLAWARGEPDAHQPADLAFGAAGRGCFDIGGTTAGALWQWGVRRQRDGAKADPFCGPVQIPTAGNGSLMRLAPFALYGHSVGLSVREFNRLMGDSSRLTHGAAEAVECCQRFGLMLRSVLSGLGRPAGRNLPKTRAAVRSTGYVVDTFTAAVWCVQTTDSFRDAVLTAANLGGDTDTVAAVAGQLAGAVYGERGIPAGWRKQLYRGPMLKRLAMRLHQLGRKL